MQPTQNNSISEDRAIVFTDKRTFYVDTADYVNIHVSEKSDEQTNKEILNWVHIAIRIAKRNLVDTYRIIMNKYLQFYLNVFIYKLNRRYFGGKLLESLFMAKNYRIMTKKGYKML